MNQDKISKKDYQELIDENQLCYSTLIKTFDKYTANTIVRLIDARIKLWHSTPIQDASKAEGGQ